MTAATTEEALTFAQLSDQRERLRRQLAWTIEHRRYAACSVAQFDKWISGLEHAIREIDFLLVGPTANQKLS